MSSPRTVALALACAACTRAPAPAPVHGAVPPPATVAASPHLAPARWAIVDRLGTLFDEAGHGSALPRPEPALVDGVRVLVDAGIVVGAARHADRFSGFRSLPERLGGGFVLWSEDRVYRSHDFLGEPVAISDVGAPGGARPWLGSVLLRTSLGLFELDPRTLSLHRAPWPGVADALAQDGLRAVRLDTFGRASVTVDGGASWTDVLATRGAVVRSLSEGPAGEILLATEAALPLVLGATGGLAPAPADPPAPGEPLTADPLLTSALPTSSRALPGDLLTHAAAGGVLLPGGRILVARDGGVRVLAAATALPLADADLASVDPRFSACQAVSLGSPPAAVVCVAETGAAVLDLDGSLRRPALEATFPAGGGGFFGGPRGRLVFDGRCGPDPPTSTDLGPGSHAPEPAPDESPPPGPTELPPDSDAFACARAGAARWVEHRLDGDDARHLYRWVPGDDGAVTALVLAPGSSPPARDGLRVIRVDPGDPGLAGGAFPAVPAPQKDLPHRAVDVDFWQEDDGAVAGWIVLPADGEARLSVTPSSQGPAAHLLPVVARRGGRRAGVRIDAAGHLTVHALPPGVVEVVTGGRFALAMATGQRWFETIDGGASWAPIEGPPVGGIEAPAGADATFACSPVGCAVSPGLVRLGWGSARPAPPPDLALTAARGPRLHEPDPLALTCHLDDIPGRVRSRAPVPIALATFPTTLGALVGHAWTGDVLPPFQPAAAPRRLSVTGGLDATRGWVAPILGTGASIDLLLVVGGRRLRAGSGPAAFVPFDVSGRLAFAADGPDGSLVLLDPDRGGLRVARGAATAPVALFTRIADVSRARLTLARRLAGGGLAVAGYSTSSGEVFAGDLDLGRAQVGPLAALGRLDGMAPAGACPRATHRLIVELALRVRFVGPAGEALADARMTAPAVIVAGDGRVCVEAVEADTGNRSFPRLLRATLGAGARASVWSAGASVGGVCAIEGG